ncbi:helix-turn-helix domain-containing protein [Paludibaculum fermentans]|uniref:helix-turn-helix domain-containing protein n=1 Tax=Paludibaculum fermentans TaxID=1473598 RepID=UPI001E36A3BE|nr:helix-turn-helix transcriptional regulator [Paludibaculum fermentans]
MGRLQRRYRRPARLGRTPAQLDRADHAAGHHPPGVHEYPGAPPQAAAALPPASEATWSEQLQTRRNQLGLSQTQAAEQLGIAQSYYSMLEKGARQPSKAIRQRLQEWMRDLETR